MTLFRLRDSLSDARGRTGILALQGGEDVKKSLAFRCQI